MLKWASKSSPSWFLMPHSLDLALWMVESHVSNVFAYGTKGICQSFGIDTWDALTAMGKLSDEIFFTLESNWILPKGVPQVFDFQHKILGSSGKLEVNISENGIKKYKDKYSNLGIAHREVDGHIIGMIQDMMKDLADFVRGIHNDVPTLDRGELITTIIEAIHLSADTSRPIKIN
jgi:predicted dehydrogenase